MPKKTRSSRPPKTIRLMPNAVALTIAGSDPSGGAGLQADLKTFQQLGIYGMSVVTVVTVQNTQAISKVEVLAPEMIDAQCEAVLSDISPWAIKTGALGTVEVIETVAKRLQNVTCPVIVDPVLVSKHGQSLVTEEVVHAYKRHLLPLAHLVTPNRFEAERLTGLTLDNENAIAEAVHRLEECGARHVLIKLGEVDGESHHVLSLAGENVGFVTPRLSSNNTHGTGCILSAAITAKLALGEEDIKTAVLFGIHRTYEAIHVNTHLGKGIHPAEIRAMGR